MNNLEVTRYSPDIARWGRRQCSDVVRLNVKGDVKVHHDQTWDGQWQ